VGVAATRKENPCLSSPPIAENVEEAQATTNLIWADIMEKEFSVLPPLFESLTMTRRGPGGSEGDSEDLDAEFTTTTGMEGEEDILVSAQSSSRPVVTATV